MCDASRFPYGSRYCRKGTYFPPIVTPQFLADWERALPQAWAAVREEAAKIIAEERKRRRSGHAGPR